MAPDGTISKIHSNFSGRKIKIMFLIRAIILRKCEGENGISLARGADKILEFHFMRKDKICEGKLHKTCSTKLQPAAFSLVFLT